MNLEPHMPCHVLGDKELGRFRRRMAARTGKQLPYHTKHCLLKALNWGWTVAMSPVASELHEVEMMF